MRCDGLMTALVVFHSLYGGTAAFASAIAEGLGPGAKAVSTGQAAPELVTYATLLVVGSPVHMRGLPSALSMRVASQRAHAMERPSEPTVREWLESVPRTGVKAAAFDTKIPGRFSGSAAPAIAKSLGKSGFTVIAAPESFILEDRMDDGAAGPSIADDELARARTWGETLASL